VPLWLGVLGDTRRLAWLGSEPDVGPDHEAPAEQRLVAGVVLIGQLEQRGELMALPPGLVLRAAPAGTGGAVTTTFLLHGVSAGGGGAAPARFEVLAVRADW
jgi:hypothetical protein